MDFRQQIKLLSSVNIGCEVVTGSLCYLTSLQHVMYM